MLFLWLITEPRLTARGSTLPPKITNNSMTISRIPWCGSADVSSILYYFKYILLYNISNTSSVSVILFFRALSLLDTSITIFVDLFYSQRLNLMFYWHSNSFMHNAEKWSCNINAMRFLRDVWPYFNFKYERDKLGDTLGSHLRYLLKS